jgi:hypothetical protein
LLLIPLGKASTKDATTGVAAEYRTLACKATAVIAVVVRISLAVLAVYLVAKL